MMEENALNKTRYTKYIGCPGCDQPMEMTLNLCQIEGDLYVWYEGLCDGCRHKVADPMPIVRAELNEVARKIMSN